MPDGGGDGGDGEDTGKPERRFEPIESNDDDPNDWVARFDDTRMPEVVVVGQRPGEDPGPAPNPYGPGGLPPDAPPVDLGENSIDPGGPDESGDCLGPTAPFDGPMPEGVDLGDLRSEALVAGNLLDQLRNLDGAEHGMFLLKGPAAISFTAAFASGNSDSIEAKGIIPSCMDPKPILCSAGQARLRVGAPCAVAADKSSYAQIGIRPIITWTKETSSPRVGRTIRASNFARRA